MTQPTAYQYVKLGSNLEFLRGISTASVMQTTSLAEFGNLLNNFSPRRYAVVEVVKVVKSLLVQLNELGLARVAERGRTAAADAPIDGGLPCHGSRTHGPLT